MTSSQVKTLLERDFGPVPDCGELVWAKLSDFQHWPDFLPGLRAISISESDSPGRGSVMELDWTEGQEQWRITRWQPGLTLELISGVSPHQLGVRFTLESSPDQRNVKLAMAMELQQSGIGSLFHRISARRKARRLWGRFEPLFNTINLLVDTG